MKNPKKVLLMRMFSFGESLIRYDFFQNKLENIYPTGTSLNFLTNLSQLGKSDLNIITALSEKKDSLIFKEKFVQHKINYEHSLSVKKYPMGSYQIYRQPKLYGWEVVYNRQESVWQQDNIILWNNFNANDWLHFDGISLMVSENSYKRTKKLLENFIKVSNNIVFDFNFRKSLGENHKKYIQIFRKVIKNVKILNISEYDFMKWFGINNNFEKSIKIFKNKFPNIEHVFGTKKWNDNDEMKINAFWSNKDKIIKSDDISYKPNDLIGQGDAFIANITYQLINKKNVDLQEALEWSIFKLNYIGDSNVPTYNNFKNKKTKNKKTIIR